MLLVPDLLQFVEKRLVTDLQFLSGSSSVPAGARQNLENDFPFSFAGGGTGRILQGNLLAIASAIDPSHKRAQSTHRERFIAQRDNGSRGIL